MPPIPLLKPPKTLPTFPATFPATFETCNKKRIILDTTNIKKVNLTRNIWANKKKENKCGCYCYKTLILQKIIVSLSDTDALASCESKMKRQTK